MVPTVILKLVYFFLVWIRSNSISDKKENETVYKSPSDVLYYINIYITLYLQ